MKTQYLIALGSNMRHPRHGSSARVIDAALAEIDLTVLARSRVMHSHPVGPSLRRYANAAAIVSTTMEPDDLLDHLKALEAAFGRRRGGQRWRARVLDIDIILWSGGIWASPGLGIPHAALRERDFVLRPASAIASGWRDPLTGLTLRQLNARLDRKRPQA
jgi:2-amino-4-hydroxy-6-hydroxymethyldihydropteridine diphosphokinase